MSEEKKYKKNLHKSDFFFLSDIFCRFCPFFFTEMLQRGPEVRAISQSFDMSEEKIKNNVNVSFFFFSDTF